MTSESEEISLKEILFKIINFLKVLSPFKAHIFYSALIMGAIMLTWRLVKQTQYIAESSFMLEVSNKGGMSGALDLASSLGIIGGKGSSLDEDKLVALVTSRRIISDVLLKSATVNGKNDIMANHYIEIYGLRNIIENKSHVKNFSFQNSNWEKLTRLEDSLLRVFSEIISERYISVKIDNKSKIVSVTVNKIPSESFSKYFCDCLVSSLSDYYFTHKTQVERETIRIIQLRADSVATALRKAEEQYAIQKDASNRLIKAKGYLNEIRLKREVEILIIMYAESIKNLESAKFFLLLKTPIIQIINTSRFPLEERDQRPVLFCLGGLIFGAVCASVFIILKHHWVEWKAIFYARNQ